VYDLSEGDKAKGGIGVIIYIDCPACGQRHGIYLSNQLFQGKVLKTPCPIMHTMVYVKLTLTVQGEASFEKSELQVAEEDAKLQDHQWRMEEGVNEDNDQ